VLQKIGLFPDVGASVSWHASPLPRTGPVRPLHRPRLHSLSRSQFFLARLDGNLGLYLGLTGQTIDGVSAFYSGYATHFVPGDRLQALEARLAELEQNSTTGQINQAINEFVADAAEMQVAGKYELVGVVRKAIDVSKDTSGVARTRTSPSWCCRQTGSS